MLIVSPVNTPTVTDFWESEKAKVLDLDQELQERVAVLEPKVSELPKLEDLVIVILVWL